MYSKMMVVVMVRHWEWWNGSGYSDADDSDGKDNYNNDGMCVVRTIGKVMVKYVENERKLFYME